MTDSVSGGSPYAPQTPGSPPPPGSAYAADSPASPPAPAGYQPGGVPTPDGSQAPQAYPSYPQPTSGYPQPVAGYPQAGAGYPPPTPGYPQGYAQPQPQPPRRPVDSLLARPVAVQPVAGTPFALAVVGVAPTASGPATGSLLAGIGSILVSLVVACFGLTGAGSGWGPVVSGAFAILAGVAGLGSVVLGLASLRQVKVSAGQVSGRGVAIAGIICGGVGLLLTVFAFATGFALVIRD